MATLEVRGTHGDLLHRVVRRGLAELRREVEAADASMPSFVWRELERYDGCGDPEGGFAWLVCDEDDHHRLVPHTCKTRAFCPACNGRRMAEQSARWCEEVLPLCPHRQWVLTAPFARRAVLAYRPELARGVLALALTEVFRWLAARAEADLGVVGGRAGAVTVEHRCSSSLELNPHFHSLVPDGVFARGPDDGLHFHRVTPTRADLEHLAERIADGCEAWLEAHGVDDEPTPDDAQAQLLEAAAAGRAGAGPLRGQRDRRSRTVPARSDDDEGPGRGVSARGWGLHAGTWVPLRDREGLRRLARYLLRPPLSKSRLEEGPDGSVVLGLRRPWRDGTTAFVFRPVELTARLAALVVRPRVHVVHFHGVLAPNAAWRPEVVPDPTEVERRRLAEEAKRAESTLAKRTRRRRLPARRAWCPWSQLLEQEFGVGGLTCPHCGGPMRVRAVVTREAEATRILATLRRSARGPPIGVGAP